MHGSSIVASDDVSIHLAAGDDDVLLPVRPKHLWFTLAPRLIGTIPKEEVEGKKIYKLYIVPFLVDGLELPSSIELI